MQRLKLGATLAALFLLSACVHPNLEKLNGQPAATGGTAFTRALHEAYKAEAAEEQKEEFFAEHAEAFATKAVAAGSGQAVLPEELPGSAWGAPLRHLPELTDARAKLVAALDQGAREASPKPAAIAQAKFDCWVEEAAEAGQDDDEAACQKAFEAALAQLQTVKQAPAAAQVAPAVPGKQFQVYFDFDKAVLTEDGRQIVGAIASTAKANKAQVVLVGKADLSGSDTHNLKLSKSRAEAVTAALVKLGVPKKSISAKWVGDKEPPVPTPAGVRDARNRVVEVTFQ